MVTILEVMGNPRWYGVLQGAGWQAFSGDGKCRLRSDGEPRGIAVWGCWGDLGSPEVRRILEVMGA